MNRSEFRYFERLRVRWAEIDAQKIVFNGHYLMYLDTAVAGYWRALALPYEQTMHALGGDLYVRKATLEYHGSARCDELLDTGIRTARIGNSSMTLDAAVFRGDRALVTGELVYVFADPATQTSRPVPPALRELLLGYEAGEPMVRADLGDWATLGEAAAAIRRAVFVEEQGIPADLEWDDADAGALHVLAVNRLHRAVGTGRLLPAQDGIARVGRMAVLPPLRGSGVGRVMLDALEGASRARGDRGLALNAQASAVGFYARLGYRPRGAPHMEAGIEHQVMTREFAPR
jgi:YbgC/YbaW family acyl-CoA thioester hydrolase